MTGWHLRAGYSSRYTRTEVTARLIEVLDSALQDTNSLKHEAGPVRTRGLDEQLEYYRRCRSVTGDCTVSVITTGDGDTEVMLLASGGGPQRGDKEAARRVLVRDIMKRMHNLDCDVTVVVA